MNTSKEYIINSSLGMLRACYNGADLLSLDLVHPGGDGRLELKKPENKFEEIIEQEISDYFNGLRKSFSLPVKPSGTPFQKKVWKALLKIDYGETITYSELAAKVKEKNYARAVAQAVGQNPILIVIPCHRVVSTNGLGGFSCGLEAKKFLLALENSWR